MGLIASSDGSWFRQRVYRCFRLLEKDPSLSDYLLPTLTLLALNFWWFLGTPSLFADFFPMPLWYLFLDRSIRKFRCWWLAGSGTESPCIDLRRVRLSRFHTYFQLRSLGCKSLRSCSCQSKSPSRFEWAWKIGKERICRNCSRRVLRWRYPGTIEKYWWTWLHRGEDRLSLTFWPVMIQPDRSRIE